jgi:DNA-directed RNA polymerase II subunit RPB11
MVFENAQDRTECWYIEPDGKQVSYEPDEKTPNCGTITIVKEDHTIANLLRHQLLSQDKVRFAGYQMPHPLQHKVLVRVEVC